MYGRDGRIGLAVLDSDLTIEPDLRRVMPEGTEIHAARVSYPQRVTPENMALAAERAVVAAQQLLPVRPAAIAWACTSGSFYEGRAGNDRLLARLAAACGDVPVTTASQALVEALKALGVERPMVGSPYSQAINDRLAAFLVEHGFKPAGIAQLHQQDLGDYELQDVDEDRLAAFIETLAEGESDAVVLSCTGLATSSLAPRMEQRIGKPVITSNLAILWHCWRLGHLSGRPAVKGRLFEKLAPAGEI